MYRLTLLVISCSVLLLNATHTAAATFTECIESTCAIITVPDYVEPGTDFEVVVEGYIEGGTTFSIHAFKLLDHSNWESDPSGMVTFTGPALDEDGFNWGGSFVKGYTFSYDTGPSTLTFVFGPRGSQHGYYDVAVQADISFLYASSVQTMEVPFDLKPRSCPNPITPRKRGVFSAAILGTPELDVTKIDPTSIKVLGFSPIHYAYDDVNEPYEPYLGKTESMQCTTAGPDGYLDMVLKFRTRSLNDVLQDQPYENGQVIPVVLTAEMVDGENLTPLIGEDILLMRKKPSRRDRRTTLR